MSRVGQRPIELSDVSCEFHHSTGALKLSRGSSGSRDYLLPSCITCRVDGSFLFLKMSGVHSDTSLLGLHRSIINGIVQGLIQEFKKFLTLTGVGYKSEIKGKYLVLNLGYSHSIRYRIPDGLKVVCTKPTEVILESRDNNLLGLVTSDLCRLRKYDPYKGKGIIVKGAFMIRKESSKK